MRKDSRDDCMMNLAANNAVVERLGLAKLCMNNCYNLKLYKAPTQSVLSEEGRITLNMGGTLAPTAAPARIA